MDQEKQAYHDRTTTSTYPIEREGLHRASSGSSVRVKIGAHEFCSEGGELNLAAFKLWIAAAAPDTLDAAALVALLTAKHVDLTKYADQLVTMAADLDATAPSDPPIPPLT